MGQFFDCRHSRHDPYCCLIAECCHDLTLFAKAINAKFDNIFGFQEDWRLHSKADAGRRTGRDYVTGHELESSHCTRFYRSSIWAERAQALAAEEGEGQSWLPSVRGRKSPAL
ncbi:hypothetical protein AGR1C_Lc80201 [Agrobacterium fabacearum TT111]|nr:hypothetical protein AGR1C_Lc80201 [Agrobacterium fabacearum TT111]